MKTILVTGGTGFIGTNLCLDLLEEGHKVVALSKSTNKNNINNPNFSFIQHDVKENFKETFLPVDEIYHLASPASNPDFINNPTEVANTIILGTINSLNFAKKNNSKFLFASSIGVYHKDEFNFRSCYDSSKRTMEHYVYTFGKENNIDCKIVRIPSVYGPYMKINDDRILTNFIKNILTKKEINFYGEINKKRPYCYVENIVEDLKRIMKSNINLPVDIKNVENLNTPELLNIVKEVISNKKYHYGLNKTVEYFKKNI